MDIGIIINTCKNYYRNLTELIPQLSLLPIPKENIIIISGQEDNESIIYESGIKIIKVSYTALHLTCAVYLNEHIDEYPNITYWLILPDTIKLGDKFFERIIYYYNLYLKEQTPCSLPFISPYVRPTMDMGFIHRDHFYTMSNYLSTLKIYSTEKTQLIQLKTRLIYNEDVIFGLPPTVANTPISFEYKNNYVKPTVFITNHAHELNETPLENGFINCVYIQLLDLYKYQRNYRGFDVDLVFELDNPNA